MKYSIEWPKKKGKFWFYGWRFGASPDFSTGSIEAPKFHLAEVYKNSNGYSYVTDGYFLWKEEGAIGYWLPADLPEPPTLADIAKLGVDITKISRRKDE